MKPAERRQPASRLLAVVALLAAWFSTDADADAVAATPAASLVGKWTFDPAWTQGTVVSNRAGTLNATLVGTTKRGLDPAHVEFDGKTGYAKLADSMDTTLLPQTNITAEAWVAITTPTTWGGIVGCIQDNGTFERGWLLGYRDSSFSFAVSGSDGSLTYMAAPTPFTLDTWYHVVGTYDGRTMRLYINGEMATSSVAEVGKINYAPAPYVIGAYKDDNEFYSLDGAVREVCVYRTNLTSLEIAVNYQAQKDLFPATLHPPAAPPLALDLGPWLQFTAPDAAEIRYRTPATSATTVEIGVDSTLQTVAQTLTDLSPATDHKVALTGLAAKSHYYYRIRSGTGTNERTSPIYDFEMDFNATVAPLKTPTAAPYPDDALTALCARAAEGILRDTGVTKGYALDYGCGDGRLALELARRSELNVVGITEDEEAADAARRRLQAAGLYGSRVTIIARPLTRLPHAKQTFNLVVSTEALLGRDLPGSSSEVFRVLRPSGGTALLGLSSNLTQTLPNAAALEAWAQAGLPGSGATLEALQGRGVRLARGPLAGAGEWSHTYGDAGATASSHDTLLKASSMQLQWFGNPGPRGFLDRENRSSPPLVKNGFYYVQGNNRLAALDAYNGRALWSLEIPNLRRVNQPRDAGNMCADNDSLYAAVGRSCMRFDAYTGALGGTYTTPAAAEYDWGYVACVSNRVYGSAVRHGSAYTLYDGPPYWYESDGVVDTAKVCSRSLFCFEKGASTPRWMYTTNGLIIDSTIAISGGRVYFVNCRNPALDTLQEGRVTSLGLWTQTSIVALDAETGAEVWRRPVTIPSSRYPIVVFLAVAGDKLLLESSTTSYVLSCFSAADGTPLWEKSHNWVRSDHGARAYHMVVAGKRVILEPNMYDLDSGAVLRTGLVARPGCSTMGAAENMAHYYESYASAALHFWDLDKAQSTQRPLMGLRGSCWLSFISGDGLALLPADSAGCSCGFPLQTCIAFSAQ